MTWVLAAAVNSDRSQGDEGWEGGVGVHLPPPHMQSYQRSSTNIGNSYQKLSVFHENVSLHGKPV